MRILLVDDEPDILDSLADALEATMPLPATYTKATSVAQARQLVDEHRFDLVLTDERMPGGTGSELLAWLLHQHPDIHRGLMSAYFDTSARFAQGKTSAEFYVHKPFDMVELVRLVEQTLAHAARSPSKRHVRGASSDS